MQPNEFFGPSRGFGQLGNGNGGGVGRKEAVLGQFRFRFLGDFCFQVAVFKNGLDDQITSFQVVRGTSGLNAVQYLGFLFFRHAPTADSFRQQFLGIGLASFGVFRGYILEDHFQAPGCG